MPAATSWDEFLTSLYFMLGGLGIFIVLFVFLHFFDFFKRLLASRMYMGDPNAPPKPMAHAFSWVMPMLRMNEEEVLLYCGLDAVVYLRMFRFSAELFGVLTLLCCPILLPINGLAWQNEEAKATIHPASNSTDYLSVSNVPPQSPSLWAHLVLLYCVTIFTLYWTTRTYRRVWELRHDYLAERAKVLHPEEYAVLVTDIPPAPQMQESSALHLVLPRTQKDAKEQEGLERRMQAAIDREESGRSMREDDTPKVFELKIPKSMVRRVFTVLRVLTMGFVQPPTGTDAAPASSISESLQVDAFFNRLYPGAYLNNQGVPSYAFVNKAYQKWRRAVTMLDRVRFRFWRAKERNSRLKPERQKPEAALVPHHRTGFLGLFGPRVESIPFWIEHVKEASEALKAEQHAAATRRRTGAAFVVFNSRRAAAVSLQISHAMHGTKWQVHMAPQPQDVKWPNTEARFWERTVRQQLGLFIFLLLVLFFYLPVSATSLFTSIANLEKWFPGITTWNTNSVAYRLLVAVVPPLGLRICYWIAPDLLILLSGMQGCYSFSSAQQLAAQRFYILLLVNVFFAYLITDTVVNTIFVILKKPQYLVSLLGSAVPSTSGFFMAYIMTSTLVLGMELLRLPIQLIVYLVRLATVGRAIADREKLWNQGGVIYHVYFPYQNLIITLGLVYSVVAPLVLPVVLFYSIVGFFVFKHQLLYVYSYPYQTGGLLWIPFVRNVLVALIIAQVTVITVFGLKQSFVVMGLACPLPILTFYAITLINSTLGNTFRVLPLELAVEVDEFNERTGIAAAAEQIGKEYQPVSMQPIVNPDLSPDAGPADNIHELINPAFRSSQLAEAMEALSPRATSTFRRYSSTGFMQPPLNPTGSTFNLHHTAGIHSAPNSRKNSVNENLRVRGTAGGGAGKAARGPVRSLSESRGAGKAGANGAPTLPESILEESVRSRGKPFSSLRTEAQTEPEMARHEGGWGPPQDERNGADAAQPLVGDHDAQDGGGFPGNGERVLVAEGSGVPASAALEGGADPLSPEQWADGPLPTGPGGGDAAAAAVATGGRGSIEGTLPGAPNQGGEAGSEHAQGQPGRGVWGAWASRLGLRQLRAPWQGHALPAQHQGATPDAAADPMLRRTDTSAGEPVAEATTGRDAASSASIAPPAPIGLVGTSAAGLRHRPGSGGGNSRSREQDTPEHFSDAPLQFSSSGEAGLGTTRSLDNDEDSIL